MLLHRWFRWPVALLALLALAACSRSEKADGKGHGAGIFGFSDTSTVVSGSELSGTGESHTVRADFNMDGLEDVAIAEKDEKDRNRIFVYLRKPGDNLRQQYYKAGRIDEDGDFTISALLSAEGDKGVDLLVIMNYADGAKEMIHYRNEGQQFLRHSRKQLSPPK